MPSSQETRAARRGIPAERIAECVRNLCRVRAADHGTIRAPRGSSRVLPELLPGAKEEGLWCRRPENIWRSAKLWKRQIKNPACSLDEAAAFDVRMLRLFRFETLGLRGDRVQRHRRCFLHIISLDAHNVPDHCLLIAPRGKRQIEFERFVIT